MAQSCTATAMRVPSQETGRKNWTWCFPTQIRNVRLSARIPHSCRFQVPQLKSGTVFHVPSEGCKTTELSGFVPIRISLALLPRFEKQIYSLFSRKVIRLMKKTKENF